eukprot:TRINITY_DN1440_c0_g1_i1.p1 TRINITY_DN1440_c0_g1~~TRINITY_DN1440_c0_g1_i1.p1  ORF type:complete len:258 (-),score=54.18 TRINITY_DN1440_c0_g1_i1:97-870(-)
MPGRVQDKVALVTGAGGAIGRTIAKTLADEGAKVVVIDMNEEEGQKVVAEIEKEHSGNVIFRKLNVTDEKAIQTLVKEVVDKWGTVDVLVNNAAAFVYGTIESATNEDWDTVLAVNVKGYALMAKHVIPVMKDKKSGSIVNIGSISSFVAQPAFCPYNTSKGAVLQLTRCLAMDYGAFWIRSNAVCPGPIDTPATTSLAQQLGIPKEALVAEALKSLFLKRMGSTQDIANAVLFLASEESSFVTGQTLTVDGGFLAH